MGHSCVVFISKFCGDLPDGPANQLQDPKSDPVDNAGGELIVINKY
jgi:hypothetical protein